MQNQVIDNIGNWVDSEPTFIGQQYRKLIETSVGLCYEYRIFVDSNIDKMQIELDFVLSELQRTDSLVKLPDYPHMDVLIAYRADLRKYDLNGDRPSLPTTPKGTLI